MKCLSICFPVVWNDENTFGRKLSLNWDNVVHHTITGTWQIALLCLLYIYKYQKYKYQNIQIYKYTYKYKSKYIDIRNTKQVNCDNILHTTELWKLSADMKLSFNLLKFLTLWKQGVCFLNSERRWQCWCWLYRHDDDKDEEMVMVMLINDKKDDGDPYKGSSSFALVTFAPT